MRSAEPRLTRWETLGAWLHVWTPPRDVPVPPVPRRKLVLWGAALAAALAIGLALAIPALDSAKRKGAAERARAEAAAVAAETARLRADQRVHYATAAAASDPVAVLERRITADARHRTRAHTLDGPVLDTKCEPAAANAIQFPASRVYKCFVATASGLRGEGNDRFATGYPFIATIYTRTRRLAWCKENPRPGEKTGGKGLAAVQLSPVCAGKLSQVL
jgi:hypothetical protein